MVLWGWTGILKELGLVTLWKLPQGLSQGLDKYVIGCFACYWRLNFNIRSSGDSLWLGANRFQKNINSLHSGKPVHLIRIGG